MPPKRPRSEHQSHPSSPQPSMAKNLRLHVYTIGLLGRTSPFQVIIETSKTVGELKKAILEKKPNDFKRVDADRLSLYKINRILDDDGDEDFFLRLTINEDQDLKLKELKLISTYWPEQPIEPLNILVKFPATISPSSSLNSNTSRTSLPSWLVEIHSELWGKKDDFFSEIFRTAILTKENFIELQNQLQELDAERTSDKSYVAQNVLATKSAFLRNKSTGLGTNLGNDLVPRLDFDVSEPLFRDVVDDDGAVADDDSAIADDAMVIDPTEDHLSNEATGIFPYTIRYVDLTVLKSEMTDRAPQLMLFRNEWINMIDLFNRRRKGLRGSAIFTGQPGIGKTCMLYSILILCLLRAQPIVFQDWAGGVFIIDNDGVRLPKGLAEVSKEVAVSNTDTVPKGEVLTLVDADGDSCRPSQYILRDSKIRILLTSSPRQRSDRKWLTQRVQDDYAAFVMEPWSREELVIASLFLHPIDITLERLQEASRICGNIPRPCFQAAAAPVDLGRAQTMMWDAISGTQSKVTAIQSVAVSELSNATELFHAVYNVRQGDPIHRAFQIRPSSEDRYWGTCLVEPVSDFALSLMRLYLCQRHVNDAYIFYRRIKGYPECDTLSEKMFEHYLRPFLQNRTQTFVIKSLDNRSNTLKIQFTSNTNHIAFGDTKYFSTHLKSSVESNTSCYLQPLSPIFTSFDSFFYQPEVPSGFSPLIALQVTTATDHAINVKDLAKVQKSLKPRIAELNRLRPIEARKMIILFVVPDTLEATFAKQSIISTTNAGPWYDKTAQYVLGLPEKEVFGVVE